MVTEIDKTKNIIKKYYVLRSEFHSPFVFTQ